MKTAAALDEWALLRGGIELTMQRFGIETAISAATMSQFSADSNQLDGSPAVDYAVVGQVRDVSQLEAVRRLTGLGIRVIALTVCLTPAALIDLCRAGAFAVVGRDGDLAAAVRAVTNGERHVAPGLLAAMFDHKLETLHQPRFDLTQRESEVLAQLVTGRSNDEISERLLIGTQTVKTHLTNIYDKLGVRRRAQAVGLALSHSLV
jgi:DNA-binding NarL/FixJ family response regulator